jgi:hypothetical protein
MSLAKAAWTRRHPLPLHVLGVFLIINHVYITVHMRRLQIAPHPSTERFFPLG